MAGNLFVLPRQVPIDSGVVVPGAKATFTKTGTTTPQDTFTDIALTTAHANPVVADSNGVFAAIYFNASFVDYRLKLTDASDVLIYQVDDVPASQSAGQSLTLTAAAPFIDFIESDASANNGVWRIAVNSEQLTIKLGNDALSSFTDILTVDRTANTVDIINLKPTTLQQNGVNLGVVTGTFVATWVGFTTSPTTTWTFTQIGQIVTIRPGAILTATSNTTGLSSGSTDVPAAIRPTVTNVSAFIIEDNGTEAMGKILISAAGAIVFNATVAAGTFTNSGAKGFPALQAFTYSLD